MVCHCKGKVVKLGLPQIEKNGKEVYDGVMKEEETKASTPPSGGQGVSENIVKCHHKDK